MTKRSSYHQDRKETRRLAAEDYYALLSIIDPTIDTKKFTPKQARHMVMEKHKISERTFYRAEKQFKTQR
jgi:hypothetical protein